MKNHYEQSLTAHEGCKAGYSLRIRNQNRGTECVMNDWDLSLVKVMHLLTDLLNSPLLCYLMLNQLVY